MTIIDFHGHSGIEPLPNVAFFRLYRTSLLEYYPYDAMNKCQWLFLSVRRG